MLAFDSLAAFTFAKFRIPGRNPVGIFWTRQYVSGAVHDELLEASRLDGCGFFRQFWHVGLPVERPALAVLGIFTFISVWNDYLWPLSVLADPDQVASQVALGQLNRTHDTDYGTLRARRCSRC